jgi:hypothetical protein
MQKESLATYPIDQVKSNHRMAIAKALLDDEDDEVFDLELLIGEAPRWIDNIMGIVLNAQKALMTRNLNTMNRLQENIKTLEECG